MRVRVVILPQLRRPEARARWVSSEERGFANGWTYGDDALLDAVGGTVVDGGWSGAR